MTEQMEAKIITRYHDTALGPDGSVTLTNGVRFPSGEPIFGVRLKVGITLGKPSCDSPVFCYRDDVAKEELHYDADRRLWQLVKVDATQAARSTGNGAAPERELWDDYSKPKTGRQTDEIDIASTVWRRVEVVGMRESKFDFGPITLYQVGGLLTYKDDLFDPPDFIDVQDKHITMWRDRETGIVAITARHDDDAAYYFRCEPMSENCWRWFRLYPTGTVPPPGADTRRTQVFGTRRQVNSLVHPHESVSCCVLAFIVSFVLILNGMGAIYLLWLPTTLFPSWVLRIAFGAALVPTVYFMLRAYGWCMTKFLEPLFTSLDLRLDCTEELAVECLFFAGAAAFMFVCCVPTLF